MPEAETPASLNEAAREAGAPRREHRWPTKVHRYGIRNPFLRMVVAKYEGEIAWSEVNDERSLENHVRSVMVPRLLARVAYPPREGAKHCFVSRRHVNLASALTRDQDLDLDDKQELAAIRDTQGAAAAEAALVTLVNARKAEGFQAWVSLLEGRYVHQPAFLVLMLRPMVELAGAGSRRSLFAPSEDVVAWLYLRIERGDLHRNDDFARVYCMRVARGAGSLPVYGWQFFESSSDSTASLTAASRGAGWCIGQTRYARSYLEVSHFWLLFSKGMPVVALRVCPTANFVQEYRGRGNRRPIDWSADIALFLATQGIASAHASESSPTWLPPIDPMRSESLAWWKERCRHWPFALDRAPDAIRSSLRLDARSAALRYAGTAAFGRLVGESALVFGVDDWRHLVEVEPLQFESCSPELRESPPIRQACLEGWLRRAERDGLTASELANVPGFVLEHPLFKPHLLAPVAQLAQRRARTQDGEVIASRLSEFLPLAVDSDEDVAVLHAVEVLLRNEDGIYADSRFPALLRARPDFARVRERAWHDAFQRDPALWFALPDDLRDRDGFALASDAVRRVDLSAWVERVRAEPWILSHREGVPKAVRLHEHVLAAYLAGWCAWLRTRPEREYVQRFRTWDVRIYVSPALHYEPAVIAVRTEGFVNARQRGVLRKTWEATEPHTRTRRPFQLAIMRAVLACGEAPNDDDLAIVRLLPGIDAIGTFDGDARVRRVREELAEAVNAIHGASGTAARPRPNLAAPSAGPAMSLSEAPTEGFAIGDSLPAPGDTARHPTFGTCTVLGYAAGRIHLRQLEGGRHGAFELAKLRVEASTDGSAGPRSFVLRSAAATPSGERRRRRG